MTSLLCVVLVGCSSSVPAIQEEDSFSVVGRVVPELMSAHDIPGMAVAVSYRGEDRFFGFGVQDHASGTPINERTLFEVGSVSKLFTATLAAQASLDGVLDLDEPIGTYIEALEGAPLGTVSVVHLATHTAGGFPLQLPDEVTTDAALLAYFQRWKPECAAGTVRHYANPSIGLLGVLVARVRGVSFVDLVEQSLFPAIGMTDSYIEVPDDEYTRYAWGHTREGDRVRVNPGMLGAEAYGVKTTSADLLSFLKLNLQRADDSNELVQSIRQTQRGLFDTSLFEQAMIWERYAFPLNREVFQAGNSFEVILNPTPVVAVSSSNRTDHPVVLSKTGSTGGFGAYVLAIPQEEFALVMLANRRYPNSARIDAAYRIVEEVLAPESER